MSILNNILIILLSYNIIIICFSYRLSSYNSKLKVFNKYLLTQRHNSKIQLNNNQDIASNSKTTFDKITAKKFHHIEFYCGDANSTSKRFMFALGADLVAKSDLSTGNDQCASYVIQVSYNR